MNNSRGGGGGGVQMNENVQECDHMHSPFDLIKIAIWPKWLTFSHAKTNCHAYLWKIRSLPGFICLIVWMPDLSESSNHHHRHHHYSDHHHHHRYFKIIIKIIILCILILSVYAMTRHNRSGILACSLPYGILVATYSFPCTSVKAIEIVEKACDLLRRWVTCIRTGWYCNSYSSYLARIIKMWPDNLGVNHQEITGHT